MSRTSLAVIGLTAALPVSSATALSSPPTLEAVQAWMDKSWENSKAFPTDHAFRLDLKVEGRDVPPPSVMNQLRRDVPGHPDHPEKNNLPMYESRLAGKFDWVEVTYWSDPITGIRRHNRTYHDFAGAMIEYSDTGIGKEVMWGLFSDKQLVIVSPSRPDPMYDFPVLLGGEINELRTGFSAGLSCGAGHIPTPVVKLDGTQWTATSKESARKIKFEARGTWDDEHDVGIITQVIMRGDDPSYPSYTLKYISTGHHYIPVLDRWAPDRIEYWKGDPEPLRLNRVFVASSAQSVDSVELKQLVALPTMDGTDPIRGPLKFASILDLRANERAYRNRNAEGGIDIIPLAETPVFRHQSKLTRYGWLSAGLVIVALVALRVRRWSKQRTSEGSSHG